MSIGLVLALIFVPAVFWTGYASYHNPCKPEPVVLTAFSYFLGFLAGWLCLRAYGLLLPALAHPHFGAPGKKITACLSAWHPEQFA